MRANIRHRNAAITFNLQIRYITLPLECIEDCQLSLKVGLGFTYTPCAGYRRFVCKVMYLDLTFVKSNFALASWTLKWRLGALAITSSNFGGIRSTHRCKHGGFPMRGTAIF